MSAWPVSARACKLVRPARLADTCKLCAAASRLVRCDRQHSQLLRTRRGCCWPSSRIVNCRSWGPQLTAADAMSCRTSEVSPVSSPTVRLSSSTADACRASHSSRLRSRGSASPPLALARAILLTRMGVAHSSRHRLHTSDRCCSLQAVGRSGRSMGASRWSGGGGGGSGRAGDDV